MRSRKIAILVTIVMVSTVTLVSVSAAAGKAPLAHDQPNIIDVRGVEDFEANALIFSTFRFDPGTTRAHTGERVAFVDRDGSAAPHSLTVVRRSDLPTSFDTLFACEPCNTALDRHFATDPPTLKVDVGAPGLDRPGDSLLIFDGQRRSADISAAAGTTLWFVCAFHPWMQARIIVG